MHLEARTLGL